MPVQKVAQINNGWVNDRSVVAVNGDLFGQSLEPAIRSLRVAIRNFNEWGNVPISTAVNRALQFNDRALLRFGSGIEFNNRLLETCLPRQLPQGVVHDGILPLSFETISTLEKQLPPVWEGMYEGLQHLQLFTGDFGGRDRAFSINVSVVTGNIEVWELTTDSRTDNQDSRVIWTFETPASHVFEGIRVETACWWRGMDFEAIWHRGVHLRIPDGFGPVLSVLASH
jgi:hypothetical protein